MPTEEEAKKFRARLKAATGQESIEGAIVSFAKRLDSIEAELKENRIKNSAASDRNYRPG